MLERELIEEIRTSNDITAVISGYLPLKRRGSSLVGLCPFHNEKTPSFHVMADRQTFHCFGCGTGGNVITFIMMIENYEFLDAVKFLAERANIDIESRGGDPRRAKLIQEKKKKLYEINKKAARFFYDCLNAEAGAAADSYITQRGLGRGVRIKCGLGYSPKNAPTLYQFLNSEGYEDGELLEAGLAVSAKSGMGYYDRFFDRLMFPIFDVAGKVVGFGGRSLGDGMPKYLNSPETPVFEKGKLLYGLNFARHSKKREIIVVEGYMDAISLYQAGFMNAVAALGTAFTPHHARLLKNYADTVILLYDSDEAGIKAAYKAFPILVAAGLKVKIAQTGGAKDPDEYLKKYGADSFTSDVLAKAKSHIAFQIDNERSKSDIEGSVDGKIEFTKEAARILKTAGSEIERDAYIKETARLTGISEAAIRAEMETETPGDGPRRPFRTAQPRPVQASKEAPDSVLKAQRGFLGIIASNSAAFSKSLQYINETDFTNDTYKQLYKQISKLQTAGKIVRAEEVLTNPCFSTADKHREVMRILSSCDRQEIVTPETERAFSDQIKAIKIYSIAMKKQQFVENNDTNAMKSAQEEEKTVKALNISLTDG